MARIRSASPRPDFDEIDVSVLTMPVVGRNLLGPRFEDQLAAKGTLIAFLRHLGCSFCREMIADMHAASLQRSDFPDVLFVHLGSILEGDALFAKLWPEARAIADPQRKLFNSFKIERGSWLQLFGPAVLLRGAMALAKGHLMRPPVSDPFLMPGLFFVRNRRLVWEPKFRHIGDHPNFRRMPELIREAEAAATHQKRRG